MKPRILALFVAGALSACDGSDPVDDDANNVGTPAEIEALPPDESAATPSNELANGVQNSAGNSSAGTIPAAMHGRWGLTPGDCTSTRGDAKGLMLVSADALRFYESVARPAGELETSADSASGDFAFTGEGMTWTRHQALRITDGKLVRTESAPMASFTYARCSG